MLARVPHCPADGLTVRMAAFDVLAVVGTDLRSLPWQRRRDELEQLLADANGARGRPRSSMASGAVHDALVGGWEGTVAKRLTGRYRCGHRTAAWLKLRSPRGGSARPRARRSGAAA